MTSTDQDHADAASGGASHQTVSYAYDTTDTDDVYDDGLRPQKTTYPAGRIIWQTYGDVGTSTNINDRLNRVRLIEADNGSGTAPDTDLIEYTYSGTGRLAKAHDKGVI